MAKQSTDVAPSGLCGIDPEFAVNMSSVRHEAWKVSTRQRKEAAKGLGWRAHGAA